MIPRGPVSWASLGLVAVAAASAVSYYQIERERRLEQAMGKIVSNNKKENRKRQALYTLGIGFIVIDGFMDDTFTFPIGYSPMFHYL
jgi:hypothetical protein